MVSCFMLKSLSHFEFIFVHGMRVCSKFIGLRAAVQLCQHHLLEETVFPFYILASFVEDWRLVCGFISGLSFLFHWSMSVFIPIPHCIDYCSFVVLSEVWKSYASCFVLLFSPLRIALAILGLLWFHINFWIICSSSVKNVMAILIWGSH